MAILDIDTFQSSANLTLWFKIRSGDSLNLADVPEIIPLRWTYFRDAWPKLKMRLAATAVSNFDPDYFYAVLEDLDAFIIQQRTALADNNPFLGSSIYYRFYPIFDSVPIEQISLTSEEKRLLASKKAVVQAFSKNDFLRIKLDLTEYRDHLSDVVGLGDPDYDRIYSRGTVVSQLTPSIVDLNLMLVLHDQLAAVNFVIANLFAVDTGIDPFALARQNADNPDLAIGQYASGYLVKLHYGEDLQALATRYLKDPNKWLDIAVANGLREPYIDEVGEVVPLLSNGRGSQINIRSTNGSGESSINKLYVGQLVLIQSDFLQFPSQRSITGIKEAPVSGEIILTLSGASDLDAYLLVHHANIRIFKPNTVNSSQFVLIPTPAPLDNPRKDEVPWFMTGAQADEKKAKIDIAVGEDGSMQFTSNGDIALSYGLANAIQAVKLKLMTERGSNRYHQKFGIVNVVGTPQRDNSDIKNILIEAVSAQINADARFDRVESLNVGRTQSDAVSYDINLVVRLAGSGTLLPISFTVAA